MFKFETVVCKVLLGAALIYSGCLAAADVSTAKNCEPSEATWSRACPDGTDLTPGTLCAKTWDSYQKCQLGTSGDECETNYGKDFRKAQSDFGKACGKIPGDCVKAINKCDGKDADGDSGDDEGDRRSSRDRGGSGSTPYNIQSEKDKLNKCPAIAGEDLEKLEKQMKEQEEKVKKLDEKMPDIQKRIDKVTSDTNEKLQNIKSEMSEKEKKLREDLQNLQEDGDKTEKAITDQVTSIAAQIQKATDGLGQVTLGRQENTLKLKRTKLDIEAQCHKSAMEQVSKMQQDVTDALKNGTYNGGGLGSMMKNIGLSDRQRFQKIANKYYQWCLDSKPIKDQKDSANDIYRFGNSQADKSEESVREQIKQLKAQQAQLMSPAACGQSTPQANGSSGGQSELCKAKIKIAQRGNSLTQTYQADVQRLTEKYQTAWTQGERDLKTAQDELDKKNREIKEEQKRLENLKQLLQVKYDKGGSSNRDGSTLAEATGKMHELITTGQLYMECVGRKTDVADNQDYCTPSTSKACSSIKTFLRSTLKVPESEVTTIKNPASPLVRPEDSIDDTGTPGRRTAPVTPADTGPGRTGR